MPQAAPTPQRPGVKVSLLLDGGWGRGDDVRETPAAVTREGFSGALTLALAWKHLDVGLTTRGGGVADDDLEGRLSVFAGPAIALAGGTVRAALHAQVGKIGYAHESSDGPSSRASPGPWTSLSATVTLGAAWSLRP